VNQDSNEDTLLLNQDFYDKIKLLRTSEECAINISNTPQNNHDQKSYALFLLANNFNDLYNSQESHQGKLIKIPEISNALKLSDEIIRNANYTVDYKNPCPHQTSVLSV